MLPPNPLKGEPRELRFFMVIKIIYYFTFTNYYSPLGVGATIPLTFPPLGG